MGKQNQEEAEPGQELECREPARADRDRQLQQTELPPEVSPVRQPAAQVTVRVYQAAQELASAYLPPHPADQGLTVPATVDLAWATAVLDSGWDTGLAPETEAATGNLARDAAAV